MADFPRELPKETQETPDVIVRDTAPAVQNAFEAPKTPEGGAEAPAATSREGRVGEQATPTPAPAPVRVPQKDALTKNVEGILSDGLKDLYLTLPENAKPLFKKKGEEVATEISRMFTSAKLQVQRIVQLIRDWLHLIPKVNTFYLEQESKIKTDQIVALFEETEKQKHDSHDVLSSPS